MWPKHALRRPPIAWHPEPARWQVAIPVPGGSCGASGARRVGTPYSPWSRRVRSHDMARLGAARPTRCCPTSPTRVTLACTRFAAVPQQCAVCPWTHCPMAARPAQPAVSNVPPVLGGDHAGSRRVTGEWQGTHKTAAPCVPPSVAAGEATPRCGCWTVRPPDHRVAPPSGRPSAGMAVAPTLRHHAMPPPARGCGLPAREPQTALRSSSMPSWGGLTLTAGRWSSGALRATGGLGGRGGAKAPSCSSSWRARLPTL